MSPFTIIVAATKANGIGQNGRLPWRLQKEMAYFARVTSSAPEGLMNAVIMGRNTWESIPKKFKPLPRRVNVVISRSKEYQLSSPDSPPSSTPAYLYHDLESAVRYLDHSDQAIHRRFIIGGASLYSESLALFSSSPPPAYRADRVLLTRIIAPTFDECDVHMPDFLATGEDGQCGWTRASHEELEAWVGSEVPAGFQEENGVSYEFQMWLRRV
ncbi:dihydrofolate reductase [Leucogyrophana mollusca]|uniref:Dihydrofolate reductase n=1 Tax=Leucogyrophana mollusca TaxID=85980 RepID=A0ACB8BZF7_9AGAM|nr:dihydrofolate reductase [Leucogyrophana mollusca]